MDRSRRAMNPENYNDDGTVRRGKKTWKKSKSIRSSNVRTVGRRSGSQEDMERSASTAGNVDMILSEELDSLVTE